ncbi:MAG TPA: protein kinase [Bryobacteraceae bacterium]|nr:protein kinase [Bryobacteraceae bacterium]
MFQVGRYQVLEEVGRGAAGVVFKARDPAINRTVAIKAIDLGEFTNPEERQKVRDRLLREAQSAGLLSHPNIVTIFDVLEEKDFAYILMEYVAGSSLERLISTRTLPDGEALLRFLRQVADALDYAHRKGVVHRDIKPANIIISDDAITGEHLAKITDFGVAKVISHEITQSGSMIGTPNYMSPEQIEGLSVDGRSDQFSLAVIAYELLTGMKPFAGENLPALFYQICKQNPKPVEEVNSTLTATVDKVLSRALAKHADERYPTCVAFIGALNIALGECPNWAVLAQRAPETVATAAAIRPGAAAATARANEVTRVRRAEGIEAAAPVVLPLARRREFDREEQPKPDDAEQTNTIGKKLAVILAMCFAIGAAVVFIVRWNSEPAIPTQVLDTKSGPVSPPPQMTDTGTEAPPAEVRRTPPERPRISPTVRTQTNTVARQSTPTAPPTRTQPERAERSPTGVELLTEPAGAHVTIDGSLSCTSPCTLELPNGRHTLSVQADGYEVARRIFNVPGDTSLYMPLAKNTGAVVLTSVPKGAVVLVDGQTVGRTPVTAHVPLGTHHITWMLNGNQHEETIEVSGGIQARGFIFQ